MERTIASWFAEGSSYLSNAWSGAGGKHHEGCSVDESSENNGSGRAVKDRSSTHESQLSTVSSTSTRSSVSGSAKKLGKVVSWMVFGSRKGGSSKSSSSSSSSKGCVVHDAADVPPATAKKTSLDVLMTAGATRPLDPVTPSSLHAVSVVGRGGYGKVMLMRCSERGKVFALKEVAKSNLIDKPKPGAAKSVRPVSTKIEHAEMERVVLGTVSEHPFITSFHGSFQNREKIFLVTEYAPGGELFGLMQRQGVFPEPRVQLYVAEIVSALDFIHRKNIIYRDLKPENILLDDKGHILLTDFGLSIAFKDQGADDSQMRCFSICGTPEYISPEIVLGATSKKHDRSWSYGKTVDWWALGVLMYEMLYRLPPFFDRERKVMLEKIIECDLVFPTPGPKTPEVSSAANEFIASLLKYHEHERLGYGNDGSAKVKAHPFFEGLDWEKVDAREYVPTYAPELKNEFDTSCFDANFTKELLREDKCSKCAYNLELTGYDYLPDSFMEAAWYNCQQQENNAAIPAAAPPPPSEEKSQDSFQK